MYAHVLQKQNHIYILSCKFSLLKVIFFGDRPGPFDLGLRSCSVLCTRLPLESIPGSYKFFSEHPSSQFFILCQLSLVVESLK